MRCISYDDDDDAKRFSLMIQIGTKCKVAGGRLIPRDARYNTLSGSVEILLSETSKVIWRDVSEVCLQTCYGIRIHCNILNLTLDFFAICDTSDCLATLYNCVSLTVGNPNLIE